MSWLQRQYHRFTRYLRSSVRVLGKTAVWLIAAVIAGFITLWISCAWTNHWLSGSKGRDFLAQSIQSATGARVHIGGITAGVPSSVQIHDLALQMPIGAGLWEKEPSIIAERITLQLALWRLLYGTFDLTSATIEGVSVVGERRDGKLWIDGLLQYQADRAAKKPAPTAEAPAKDTQPLSLSDLRGTLAKVIVPLRIVVGEVGIKRLTIEARDFVKNREVAHVKLGPIHALVGGSAWLGSGQLWVDVAGDEETNQLTIQAVRNGKTEINQKAVTRLRIDLVDLKRLLVSMNLDKTKVPVKLDVDIQLADDLSAVTLRQTKIEIGSILTHDAAGTVRFIDDHLRSFDIDLKEQFKINLTEMSPFLAPFAVSTSGLVELKELLVQGRLDLDSLATPETMRVPQVQLALLFDQVKASSKAADLEGLDGSILLTLKPLADGGLDIEHAAHLKIAELKLRSDPKLKSSKELLVIRGLALENAISGRNITRPDAAEIDRLQVKLNIDQWAATPPGKATISAPLDLRIEGNTQLASQQGQVKLDLNVGSLSHVDTTLQCSAQCKRLQLDTNILVQSSEQLFGLVQPLIAASDLPRLHAGQLNVKVAVDAAIPGGDPKDFSKRLKAARPTVNADIKLNNLGTDLIKQKIKIAGINLHVQTKGNLDQHQIATKLELQSIEVPQLAGALTKNEFQLKASGHRDGRIALDDVQVTIPSLGTHLKLKGTTELGSDQLPQRLHLAMALQMDPSQSGAVPKVAEIQGRGDLTVRVDADDLTAVIASGDLRFTDFNVSLKKPNEAGVPEKLIELTQMQGSLPFKQKIDVRKILAAQKKPAKEPATPEIRANTTVAAESVNPSSSPPPQVSTDPDPAAEDAALDRFLARNSSATNASSRMPSEYYGEVRPLYKDRRPLTIERIQLKDLIFDHIEVDAELKQNMFSLNQMVLGVLDGKVQMSALATFDTTLREVRVTSQWTRLDTRKLADSFPKIRERMNSFSVLASSPYIDGTMRLAYDAVSGDIAGGVEITSIGKEQLKAVLLYIDPDDKNPTIVSMRKALAIGEVRQVSVPIRNGQIGLDVDVRLLGAPLPTPKLQRFPLAQLVRNFTNGKPAKPNTIDKKEGVQP